MLQTKSNLPDKVDLVYMEGIHEEPDIEATGSKDEHEYLQDETRWKKIVRKADYTSAILSLPPQLPRSRNRLLHDILVPCRRRGLRIAFVAAHATLAGAFGGVVAFGVGHLNRKHGLQGFRWLFIIEGLVTVLFSVPLLFCLPDYPSRAKWLTGDEKKLCEQRLQEQGAGYTKAHATRREIIETCFSPRMVLHYLTYIFNTVPLASFTFYTATIVTGLGYQSLEAQLLTIPPWVVAYLCALLYAYLADRYNARGYYAVVSSIVGGLGWLISGCLPAHAFKARYGCLVLAAVGPFPCVALFSTWVTGNVPSVTTMALAMALNNSMSGISQIVAQWIWIANEAGRGYPTGNFTCAACSFAVAILSLIFRFWYGRMNKAGVTNANGNSKTWVY
ncbi:hypothetical protein B7463_g7403, partial [Scytalidium lignicola]